jgi:hypothetical protein
VTGTVEYLVEHIRRALAEGTPHHMGLTVHADEDTVRIRGPIDSEADRSEILRIVAEHAEGRAVLDDLECPELDTNVHTERLS